MSKDRSNAFFDAVLAIVMTILVLELERPDELTWQALWNLKESYFAYTLSFFWLGTMWINIHNLWEKAKKISLKTIWAEMFLLFFSSFFPYTTALVSDNFQNSVAQFLYGIVVMGVTLSFMWMSSCVMDDNKEDKDFVKTVHAYGYGRWNNWIVFDMGIKLIGLILSITIFPPATLICLLVTLLFFVLPNQIKASKEEL